jgi:predicted acyl esterase
MSISRRELILSTAAVLTAAPVLRLSQSSAQAAPTGVWRLPSKGEVKTIENTWIVMPDGIRLSARLWMPATASAQKFGVVLEYIPYRKRDLYRSHDDAWGQTLAQYGIAYARVDARGSGESEGIIVDEYLEQELDDGVQIIAWLANQPWSNGAVGMRGISWGGINTLQIAAKAPPALKAIMPMCCTDTRYTDDAHYIGGALGLTDLQWGVQFKGVMALPPDPAIVGPSWKTLWQERLDSTPAIMETWLEHQRNDAYWKRGSVSTDYGAIKSAVYIVDGWVDTYVNTVTRILAEVRSPRKALFGPWAHNYPESTSPGPSLEWAFEEVRWWKQWLENVDTRIMQEPMLRAYMPYRTSSEVYPQDTPGRWVAESSWPPKSVAMRTWYLNGGRLNDQSGATSEISYRGDKIVGLQKPEWLPFPPEGLPGEQTPDDLKSLVFDSKPLPHDMEILGHPVAKIRVAADQPVAKLALRLCEVDAEGKSWLVTYGLMNLTHRGGDESPEALVPGKPYDVVVPLSLIAHRFKRGNRLRLSISESLWPLVWPSPKVATLTITQGISSIQLPIRTEMQDPAFPIPIKAGDKASATRATPHASGPDATGWYTIEQSAPEGSYVLAETGTAITGILGQRETLRIREGDNASCVWKGEVSRGFKRDQWDVKVAARYQLSCTPENFVIEETLQAFEGETEIFARSNKAMVRRELI